MEEVKIFEAVAYVPYAIYPDKETVDVFGG